ncbi:MAG TPA: ABC transporter permease [Pyrinomonadaceae bacterium]
MNTILKDIRLGVRSLLKQPNFTIVAVITLALGIGATTTIFSILNGLVLRPPAIADADRVVAIWRTPQGNHVESHLSYPELQDWRKSNHSFEDIAAYKRTGIIMTDQQESDRVSGMYVTANFFPLLRVNPVAGRNFDVQEEHRNSSLVAIISYEFWQSRFGGDQGVLNRQVTLNGKPHTIIGILPQGFDFPLSVRNVEVWTTVADEGENLEERGAFVFRAFGRLKPGVTIQQAQTEMTAIAANLTQAYPSTNKDSAILLVSAHDHIVGSQVRRALWLLLGAVGFILLISCTNAANLLLVRAITKQRETAIRAALGAGRWRIAVHSMIESLLLSLMAGFIGLLSAVWAIKAIKFYGADQLPRLHEVQIDARVMIFALIVSAFAALLFGLVPMLKAARSNIYDILRSGTKTATSVNSLRLWADALVVSEVALSLILLVGAGLMIRSFAELVNVPPGFDPRNVLTGNIVLTAPQYDDPGQRLQYVNETLARLKALPGVEHAAYVAPLPFSGADVGGDFRIEGRDIRPGDEPTASVRSVSIDYFRAMKIPIVKGRDFNEADRRGGAGAAIINERLARLFFANDEPLGKYITDLGSNQNEGDPERWEIVGVSSDIHHNSLSKRAGPELYLPYQQNSWRWGNFIVRTSVDPSSLSGSFREQIRAGDQLVALSRIRPLDQLISSTVNQPRFYAFLFGLFGVIGLLLTITGIYGVISYTVAQRTQEIGIRMALGAQTSNVMKLVIGEVLILALIGVALGVGCAFGLTRFMRTLLFGVAPTDPMTFVVLSLLSVTVAVLACFLPARRATKVDPIVALRSE